MYVVKQFLNSLEHYELTKLKQQLEKGKIDFVKEIEEKIKEHERKHEKFCVTCSNDLDPFSTNNYTLLFGPEDFKKKASFCGQDCLEYFLLNLKQLKKGDEKTKCSNTNVGDKDAKEIE